jgi:predicted Rossmann fold nucleotide-binding protein DprA/Smf involved in DNA uptake
MRKNITVAEVLSALPTFTSEERAIITKHLANQCEVPVHLPIEEQAVLKLLNLSVPTHVNDIMETAYISPAQINASLLMLELKGYAQRRPGNNYIRLQR